MSFRIERNGFVIHAETAADVHALVGFNSTREEPAAPRRNGKARQRGASNGALDGRILEVLGEHGAMSPAALTKAVKAERMHVRKAVKELAAAGKVSVEGSTANRLITLAKKS